jgi:hypothetical protein
VIGGMIHPTIRVLLDKGIDKDLYFSFLGKLDDETKGYEITKLYHYLKKIIFLLIIV